MYKINTTVSLLNVMLAKLALDRIGEQASRTLVKSEDKLDSRFHGDDNGDKIFFTI